MKQGFQRELAQSCFEATFEVDGICKIFEDFKSRNFSRLSGQEHDLFNELINDFEHARKRLHQLYVFAKYTEEA